MAVGGIRVSGFGRAAVPTPIEMPYAAAPAPVATPPMPAPGQNPMSFLNAEYLSGLQRHINPADMEAQIKRDAQELSAQAAARRGFTISDEAGQRLQMEMTAPALHNYRMSLMNQIPEFWRLQQAQQQTEYDRQARAEDMNWAREQQGWARQDRAQEMALRQQQLAFDQQAQRLAQQQQRTPTSPAAPRGGAGAGGGMPSMTPAEGGFSQDYGAGFGKPGALLSHKTGAELGQPFWMRGSGTSSGGVQQNSTNGPSVASSYKPPQPTQQPAPHQAAHQQQQQSSNPWAKYGR